MGYATTTSVTIKQITLPVAPLGELNPLPPVQDVDLGVYEPNGSLPPQVEANMKFGRVKNVYPYLLQDQYSRDRRPSPVTVAVLENQLMRATFALEYGGRLISLIDKTTERELLFTNPVIQPANLALRNAWISGGIEWNVGVRGHSPLTCSAIYAGAVSAGGTATTLRLWEYERIRGLVYQIDFTLDPDRPLLVWRTRVRNLRSVATAMYWWTNIAVPERNAHIFARATTGIRTRYSGGLEQVDLRDGSYIKPSDAEFAADLFYQLDEGDPWIAAVDDHGIGLAHVSSFPLVGRKLFVWGNSDGGRQWNRWLNSDQGGRYAEIQAGLTTTQYEHLPMPASTDWGWTEAVGPVALGEEVTHSPWSDAIDMVSEGVDRDLPAASIDALSRKLRVEEDIPPTVLFHGGAWYSTEAAVSSEKLAPLPGTPFGVSRDAETRYWLDLADGAHATPDPATPPASYVSGDEWLSLLSEAPVDWSTVYHQAVIRHARGELESAMALYARSIDIQPNAWSFRGMALISAGDRTPRSQLLSLQSAQRAVELAPHRSLIIEMTAVLLEMDRPTEADALLEKLPMDLRNGRTQILEIRIALKRGDLERARVMFLSGIVVADLREGEESLSTLWREVFPGQAVPEHYNFEMQAAAV